MLTVNNNPVRVLVTILVFCFCSIVISSCSNYNDDPTPSVKANSQETSKDAFSRLSAMDETCPTMESASWDYRMQLISTYGSSAGTWYDDLQAELLANSSIYMTDPAYTKIFNYYSQIEAAIKNGSKDLLQTYCTANTTACNSQTYSTSMLSAAIAVYLNPVKTLINNDSSLTTNERRILNEAILAYENLFEQVTTDYGIDVVDCYANPAWWNSTSAGGGMQTSGFFSGLGKVIRKIINGHATVLTKLVKGAIQGAIYGLGVGAPFGMAIDGLKFGALCGAGVGFVNGIHDCINGNYICLVSCS